MVFARLTLAVSFGSLAHVRSSEASTEPLAVEDSLIDDVNAKQAGWVAAPNERFKGVTLKHAASMLGSRSGPEKPSVAKSSVEDTFEFVPPVNFDSRTQWPGCIHAIRDQGSCGGCWAFGATEVLSDRFCIASKGKVNISLSPQDLISCDIGKYTMGCDGGVPEYAWKYLETTGISTDECIPYMGNKTEVCPTKCVGDSDFHKYKVATGTTRLLDGAASAAQQYLWQGGPIQAAMVVYKDFFSYKSGIYSHVSGEYLGKHSVKIVGYGVDAGIAYWTVANSWGPTWGNEGFFNIKRGCGESGIENEMVYGTPSLTDLPAAQVIV